MMDDLNLITAISAVDGRYRGKIKELAPIVSEYGLIRNRVQVECEWFLFLSHTKEIKEIREISDADVLMTRDIYLNFSVEDAERIKEIVLDAAWSGGVPSGDVSEECASSC